MKRTSLLVAAFGFGLATTANAEPPKVAVDILPVHSIVSRVMSGVATPDLVLPPGASPHGYAMRPSEAAMLEQADIVFWVGEALTPWLERAIDTLAGDATVIELLHVDGVTALPFRDGATFENHEHDHDRGHESAEEKSGDKRADTEHDHKSASGHDHEREHKSDKQAAGTTHAKDEHGHDHAREHSDRDHEVDPHVWLSPENAKVWADAIAAALSKADPDNAVAYAANAIAAKAEIDQTVHEIGHILAPVRGKPFIVFHDAYHYFEAKFEIEAAGAVSIGDASDPGPARVAEIRDTVKELGVVCVFSEPQFPPRLVRTIIEGTSARAGVLDPLGSTIPPGANQYTSALRALAVGLVDCLN